MPEMPQSEIDALGGFRFLANQYGGSPQSVLKKIQDLEEDNRKQREQIKAITEAQPKDGQVVVTKEDQDELAAFRALGKPADIKKTLEAGENATKELSTLKLRESAAKFAKASGLHEETVDTLIAIPQLANATFEVRKGKVKNKSGVEVDGEIGYIKLAGNDEKAMTLTDLQEKVPAVKGLRLAESGTQPTGGQNFVPQGGGSGGDKPGNIYDRIRAEHGKQNVPTQPVNTPVVPQPKSIEERLGMVHRS
jgi:hypothetical protein